MPEYGYRGEANFEADSFETQFKKRETYEILDGTVEAVDVQPNNPEDSVPVVMVPGWSESPTVLKSSMKTLVEQGRRAISFTPPEKGVGMPSGESEHGPAELRKSLALIKVLEQKDMPAIDAIAHSEGAINIAIAASMHPEKFRNIVFVEPAGMMGPDKFPKLAARFSLSLIKDSLKSITEPGTALRRMKAGAAAVRYSAQNFKNALNEVTAISESDIHALLKDLKAKGIGISVIHGVDDPVFPMDKVQAHTHADEVDGFYSVKGGHNEIYANSEKYTKLANEALKALQNKREKQNTPSA